MSRLSVEEIMALATARLAVGDSLTADLIEARATVAQLVEAITPLAASLTARIDQGNAMSPQAVMVRRVNDALRAMGVQS